MNNSFKIESSQINLLKWLAILSMIVDHFYKINIGSGLELFQNDYVFYIIGRIAYPAFVLILIYNYIYNTRNKGNYIKRLLLFSLISQPFFMYAFSTYSLNIFFSFLVVLTAIFLIEKIEVEKKVIDKTIYIFFIGILSIISYYTDYSIYGFLFSISIYITLRFKKLTMLLLSLILLYITNDSFNIIHLITNKIELTTFIIDSLKTFLAMIIVYFIIITTIKNKININIKPNRYIFYVFYPLHLFLFKIIS